MTTTHADVRYKLRMAKARVQLKNIKKLLESHDIKSGTAKHWGHAGDLAQVNSLLNDVELRLGGNN